MNFYDQTFLLKHCQDIMNFYDPNVMDPTGGYHQNYKDDGTLFTPGFKQLVSSTRIIVNYATAARVLNRPEYIDIAKHGLAFLENVHWCSEADGYAWTLQDNIPQDMTQQAYGYAFVLLAYAACKKAGIIDNNGPLDKVYQQLEERFWLQEHGLYADEINAAGELSDYRGQNSNMHMCEAMLAAYEASKDEKYLQRAITLAENIAFRQAALTDNLIWEHYKTDFQPDWEYNKDDPKNLYRPWGFQPGHQTEWTKLLLTLHKHSPDTKWLKQAKQLFERAYEKSWDNKHGGLIYGFGPDGECCDDDKYFWVQAESFAAASMLYEVTGEQQFLDAYKALWDYSWKHMVDHKYGAWFRVLHGDNSKYSDEKSAAGAKCDYHTLGSCFEVLKALGLPALN
ncbi:MAG: mannose/cellobiose epimerase-like protein (N-acyl-D-glucosamine 2-epimerase family) [Paraglaciecola sp.]|jgi:mannose/cellobiose epimerase-like protein (N-acyl-D-glucosamine 2-epimerase family)